jgi:heme/copper-type cytochrome/quinol oxidase subunit 2
MPGSPARSTARWATAAVATVLLAAVHGDAAARAQSRREFTVTARKFAFKVSGSATPEIRVALGDLVHITFEAEDIPHSFTTVEANPHYRIDRRAEPGKPVSFDIHADQVGTVAIHCTLTIEPRCKDMVASLVVTGK